MDQPLLVGVGQRARDLRQKAPHYVPVELFAAAYQAFQQFAGQLFHHDEPRAIRLFRIQNAYDVVVRQARDDAPFSAEMFSKIAIIDKRVRQHLERDRAPEAGMPRLKDRRHAARSQRTHHLILADFANSARLHQPFADKRGQERRGLRLAFKQVFQHAFAHPLRADLALRAHRRSPRLQGDQRHFAHERRGFELGLKDRRAVLIAHGDLHQPALDHEHLVADRALLQNDGPAGERDRLHRLLQRIQGIVG